MKLKLLTSRESNASIAETVYDGPSLLLPEENYDYYTLSQESIIFQFNDDFFDNEFLATIRKRKMKNSNRRLGKRKRKSYMYFDFNKNNLEDMLKKAEDRGLV